MSIVVPIHALEFRRPGAVSVVREERSAEPPVLPVRATFSGVSSGTEKLVFRGDLPRELSLDDALAGMDGRVSYPLRYGYSLVGRVHAGAGVPADLAGQRVFCFHPHASYACVHAGDVLPIPDDVDDRSAVLFPLVETALTLVQDAAPRMGESIAIIGLGLLGLLTTALLVHNNPGLVVAVEPREDRRTWADLVLERSARRNAGSYRLVSSAAEAADALGGHGVANERYPGFDRVVELSSNGEALQEAIDLVGYGGSIVVGSWYGSRAVDLRLGGRFHRARQQIVSSQVTTIAPELRGRWDRARRTTTAWELLRRVNTKAIPTRYEPISNAQRSFEDLDRGELGALQLVFTYSDTPAIG